jgi:hypothetical protein
MRRPLLLVLTLLPLLSGCPRPAADPSPEPRMGPSVPPRPHRLTRKEKLVQLLNGREMPTERQLRALGAGVDSDMVDIINNRSADQALRIRAIHCMGYFQNRRARLLLRSVLTDPNWDKPYRVAALAATARSVGSDAFETVKEYTLDPDRDMRLAAVHALVVIGSPSVVPLLKTLQTREQDAGVLDAIDDAIRTVGRSPMEGR